VCSQLVALKNKFIRCSSGMLCGVDWQFFGGVLFCFFVFVCLFGVFLSFFHSKIPVCAAQHLKRMKVSTAARQNIKILQEKICLYMKRIVHFI
jgi:hypothetical protein